MREMTQTEPIEPILKLLTALTVFFAVLLIGVEWLFKDDAQIFQVFSTLLAGISGALVMRVTPRPTSAKVDTPVASVQINQDDANRG